MSLMSKAVLQSTYPTSRSINTSETTQIVQIRRNNLRVTNEDVHESALAGPGRSHDGGQLS